MDLEHIILSIKRRDTRASRLAFDAYKRLLLWDVPDNDATRLVFGTLHGPDAASTRAATWARSKLLYAPMARARCESVGRNFNVHMPPHVRGTARIRVGADCTFDSFEVLSRSLTDSPLLTFGDGCYVGGKVSFVLTRDVTVGAFVHIGRLSDILDGEGPRPVPEGTKPIVLSDHAWIGNNVQILEGARVGRGAVIAPGSVVTTDIPDYALAIGVPARVVKVRGAPVEEPAPSTRRRGV
jgi:acetyltransferase-like isoleucine patch superfamily enzyme